ncbi:MAG: hypothetical protein ACP5MK_02170 [Candidatus Micrarchaeia archaeon]
MQQYKAVIFSLDTLLSIPIAILSVLLLIESYSYQAGSIAAIYNSDYSILRAQAISQEIIYGTGGNFSNAFFDKLGGIAKVYPVNDAFNMSCGISYLCRIVTIKGSAYLMVFSYENASVA